MAEEFQRVKSEIAGAYDSDGEPLETNTESAITRGNAHDVT